MRRCDDLARAIVLSRGRCEGRFRGHRCRGPLQWAHIQSRRYHAIRHDEDNALCLCSGAHLYFTNRPLEWIEFIGEERWLALKRRALAQTRVDWRQREADLIARARELGIVV